MSQVSQFDLPVANAATCAVCLGTFQVIASSGLLRKYGHGRDQPVCCRGSYQPPLVASFIHPPGTQSSQSPLVVSQGVGGGEGRSSATAFILDRPKGPTLPH